MKKTQLNEEFGNLNIRLITALNGVIGILSLAVRDGKYALETNTHFGPWLKIARWTTENILSTRKVTGYRELISQISEITGDQRGKMLVKWMVDREKKEKASDIFYL